MLAACMPSPSPRCVLDKAGLLRHFLVIDGRIEPSVNSSSGCCGSCCRPDAPPHHERLLCTRHVPAVNASKRTSVPSSWLMCSPYSHSTACQRIPRRLGTQEEKPRTGVLEAGGPSARVVKRPSRHSGMHACTPQTQRPIRGQVLLQVSEVGTAQAPHAMGAVTFSPRSVTPSGAGARNPHEARLSTCERSHPFYHDLIVPSLSLEAGARCHTHHR